MLGIGLSGYLLRPGTDFPLFTPSPSMHHGSLTALHSGMSAKENTDELMRTLLKCFNSFKGEFKEHMYREEGNKGNNCIGNKCIIRRN